MCALSNLLASSTLHWLLQWCANSCDQELSATPMAQYWADKSTGSPAAEADTGNYSTSPLQHEVMPSEPSWFPLALTLEGFYLSLLVFISKFLSLLPLLTAHVLPISSFLISLKMLSLFLCLFGNTATTENKIKSLPFCVRTPNK